MRLAASARSCMTRPSQTSSSLFDRTPAPPPGRRCVMVWTMQRRAPGRSRATPTRRNLCRITPTADIDDGAGVHVRQRQEKVALHYLACIGIDITAATRLQLFRDARSTTCGPAVEHQRTGALLPADNRSRPTTQRESPSQPKERWSPLFGCIVQPQSIYFPHPFGHLCHRHNSSSVRYALRTSHPTSGKAIFAVFCRKPKGRGGKHVVQ